MVIDTYITYIALVDGRGHRSNRYMFEVWPDMLRSISVSIPIVRSTGR